MATSAKSNSLAREMVDALTQQGFTVTQSFDTDGSPLIRVGTAGAGNQTALLKVKAVDQLGTDGIGLTPRSYTPHVLQIVLETSTVANVALLTEDNETKLLMTMAVYGLTTEMYMSANGNATGPEDIIAGNLKVTWYPSPKWKTMSSQ